MLSISIINLHNNRNYITNDHSCDIRGEAKRQEKKKGGGK